MLRMKVMSVTTLRLWLDIFILHSKLGLGLERDEAGGGHFLSRQFNEYGHYCTGRDGEVSSSLEHIVPRRFQSDRGFSLGFANLNGCLACATVSAEILVGVIHYVEHDF